MEEPIQKGEMRREVREGGRNGVEQSQLKRGRGCRNGYRLAVFRAWLFPGIASLSEKEKRCSWAHKQNLFIHHQDQTPYSCGIRRFVRFLSLGLVLLLLLHLEQQRTVDTWQDTTESDGGADQSIQLLVTTDGQLQVAGRDTLDFQVLSSVTGKFENFRSQVFQNSCDIDRS